MGSYRLVLAATVLLYHADGPVLGWHIGVIAAISFFLISGFVMTKLIGRYYAAPDRVAEFYLDRVARLFPQFLFYLLITGALIAAVKIESPFLGGCDAAKVALNAAMLPLDFYQMPRLGISNCLLIPQAWSLGLELCFYLAAPAIVLMPRASRWATAASIAMFLVACLGLINTDLYGYRLLPGVLFIFITGAAFADAKLVGQRFPWIVWAVAALLFAVVMMQPRLYALAYSKEVLAGILIGIPMVAALGSVRFSAVDEFMGNLSYGIFLNHFFCLWLLQAALGDFTGLPNWTILLLLPMSAAMALLSYYLIELPALRWRRQIRYKVAPGSHTMAANSASTPA